MGLRKIFAENSYFVEGDQPFAGMCEANLEMAHQYRYRSVDKYQNRPVDYFAQMSRYRSGLARFVSVEEN